MVFINRVHPDRFHSVNRLGHDGAQPPSANSYISARILFHPAVALALLCLILPLFAVSQTQTLAGTVRDASTNEILPFVTVYVKGLAIGTSTDANGMFRLSLKSGSYDIITSLVGYRTETRRVEMKDKNQTLDLKLFQTDILLQEVTVYSSAPDQTSQAEVGALSLQGRHITETTTVIPDVFRSVQTLPGISSDNEFSARFNVRGGTPDENLVLVNGAQVYEPFHVKEAPNASIGIFNTDMMRKVMLVTGGFSAKYGDRMSAVMDIEYREGSRARLQGSGTLSMTNLALLLEGPITSSGSFIIGARKSYEELCRVCDVADGHRRIHTPLLLRCPGSPHLFALAKRQAAI